MEINITLYTIPQEACDSKKMNWKQAAKMLQQYLNKNLDFKVNYRHIEFMDTAWFEDSNAQKMMETKKLNFPFVIVNNELACTGTKINLSKVLRKSQEIITKNKL